MTKEEKKPANYSQLKLALQRGLNERKEYENALADVDALESLAQDRNLAQQERDKAFKEKEEAEKMLNGLKAKTESAQKKASEDADKIIKDAEKQRDSIIKSGHEKVAKEENDAKERLTAIQSGIAKKQASLDSLAKQEATLQASVVQLQKAYEGFKNKASNL